MSSMRLMMEVPVNILYTNVCPQLTDLKPITPIFINSSYFATNGLIINEVIYQTILLGIL